MTMRPDCPRCKEPITSAEEHRYRAGLSGQNLSKSNAALCYPNFYEIDGDGNSWWMCPVCGLLWVPSTGRRNNDLGIGEDAYPRTRSGRKGGAQ